MTRRKAVVPTRVSTPAMAKNGRITGDGKHAGDDYPVGKDHDGDGKHAGDDYPGGKHDGDKHDGNDHKGPVLVECKHPLRVEKGQRLCEAWRARPGLLRLADGQDRQFLELRSGLHLPPWRLLPAAGGRGGAGGTRTLRSGRPRLRAGRTRT